MPHSRVVLQVVLHHVVDLPSGHIQRCTDGCRVQRISRTHDVAQRLHLLHSAAVEFVVKRIAVPERPSLGRCRHHQCRQHHGPHLILRMATSQDGSWIFGAGGGVMRSLGGVQPYLRQVACTSDPLVHLKSGWPTGTHGLVLFAFIRFSSSVVSKVRATRCVLCAPPGQPQRQVIRFCPRFAV